MILLVPVLLALAGGLLIGAALGWRAGHESGYLAGLTTDWSSGPDPTQEAGA